MTDERNVMTNYLTQGMATTGEAWDTWRYILKTYGFDETIVIQVIDGKCVPDVFSAPWKLPVLRRQDDETS